VLSALQAAARLAPGLDGIREELAARWPASIPTPQFRAVVAHAGLRGAAPPAEAAALVERMLPFDRGRFFELRGRGVGRVVELHPQLGKVRLDFGERGELTLRLDEAEQILRPIPATTSMRGRNSTASACGRSRAKSRRSSCASFARARGGRSPARRSARRSPSW